MTPPPSPEMVTLAEQCWRDIVSGAKDELVSGDLRYARTPREECEQIILRHLTAAYAQGRAEGLEAAATVTDAAAEAIRALAAEEARRG